MYDNIRKIEQVNVFHYLGSERNGTEVTLKLTLNVYGDFNDENNFPHKLLLTNTQISKLHKAFANNSSANRKLSKTQLHKIGQSRWFLARLLRPLLITEFILMKHVLKPLAKNVSVSLELIAAASAKDVAIHKKMFGFCTTILIVSDEEMNDIIKIVKSLKESGLLIKDISKTIKNEAKEQKGGFLSMLLSTLGASLLGNLLTGKVTIRAGICTLRACQDFWCCLMRHSKYYQNKPKLNAVSSRNNLPKIKDESYVI